MRMLKIPAQAVVLPTALTLLLAAAGPVQAQDATVQAELRRLAQRLEQLEVRNAALERELAAMRAPATAPAAVAQSVAPAPAPAPAAAAASPAEARLDRLERRVENLAPPAPPLVVVADDDAPRFEAGVVAVSQAVNDDGADDGRRQHRLNYRGDVVATLPAGRMAGATVQALAQVRFGQGTGPGLRPTLTSTVNSVGFETGAGPDDSFAILAQAWMQWDWALSPTGFNDLPGSRVEFTLGKIDVFGFFDQNAVAGDEGAQFLNNVFVHNPLLDAGGDIGADAYGFAPGARASYINVGDNWTWAASLGAFGAGGGANFTTGGSKPFVIAQLEASPMQINGEPRASYRVYAWTNGQTTDLDGLRQRHSGLGVSLDQRVGAQTALFARLGHRFDGDGTFDNAWTLGAEQGGRLWGRARDAAGVAVGGLKTGSAWRRATADGSLAGYAARGSETNLELYYRWFLNEHVELSPDVQYIRRAGGDTLAPSVTVLGLRASVGF